MTELHSSHPIEAAPPTPEQTLLSVGKTPEQLSGTRLVFFGNKTNSLEGKVTGAEISDFNADDYFYADKIVPKDNSLDLVLSSGSIYLAGDLSNPDEIDLMTAVVDSLKENGEARIANPAITPGRDNPEIDYARALDNIGYKVEASYVKSTPEHQGYLILKPKLYVAN